MLVSVLSPLAVPDLVLCSGALVSDAVRGHRAHPSFQPSQFLDARRHRHCLVLYLQANILMANVDVSAPP